jgi:hypothetical protein
VARAVLLRPAEEASAELTGPGQAAAKGHYEDALALYLGLGDEAGAADARSSPAWVAAATGDWTAARRGLGEAVAVTPCAGTPRPGA